MVTYHQSYGDPFLSVISIFSSIVSAGLGSLPCILKVTLFISWTHNFAKSLSTCPGWRWHTLPCPISHSHWNMKVSLYNQRRKTHTWWLWMGVPEALCTSVERLHLSWGRGWQSLWSRLWRYSPLHCYWMSAGAGRHAPPKDTFT